jgi:hypothetical protein
MFLFLGMHTVGYSTRRTRWVEAVLAVLAVLLLPIVLTL